MEEIQIFPIDKLKIGRSYQRKVEPGRLQKIIKSMKQDGFWSWEAIVVNQNFYVIDGQHRLTAAKNLNIKQVPVSIINCADEEEEANWFSRLNSFNTRLSPLEFWNARYIISHPIAKLIYFLNDDPQSLLHKKIVLKNHNTNEYKFSISQVIDMIGIIVFGLSEYWCFDKDERFTKLFSSCSHEAIMLHLNKFFKWFFACFGENKTLNPKPYLAISTFAISLFYFRLDKSGYFTSSRSFASSINKMGAYPFPADWSRIGYSARLNNLINYWNYGRTLFKLQYEDITEG